MTRRFLGSFLLSLSLCYCFVDYLLYSGGGHSPLGGFWRFLGIVTTDAYDALSSFYLLSDTVFLFLSGICAAGILVIWFSLRKAKKAMDCVTASNTQAAVEEPRPMSEGSLSETVPVSAPPSLPSRISTIGVAGKMIGGFAFVAGMFCLISLLIVYHGLFSPMEREIHKRANFFASELGGVAASYIEDKNFSALRREVARYASREDIAYIAVKDKRGKLIALSPADYSFSRQAYLSEGSLQKLQWAQMLYREISVNETLVELEKGIGLIYIGMRGDIAEQELRRVLRSFGWLMIAVLIVAVMAFALLVRITRRRLQRLARSAEQISKGNFEIAVSVGRKDEIDELACSLERMRSSLSAVMTRLERSQPSS